MKIAVFHNLPSGGAKRALHGFVTYLIESGNMVDVFIPSTAGENFLPLKDITNKIVVFPVTKTLVGLVLSPFRYRPIRGCSLVDLERVQEGIAHAINEGAYDIAFIEQDQFTISPFILKFLKKPTVYYCQQPSRFNEAISLKLYQTGNSQTHPWSPRKILRTYFTNRMLDIDSENASFASYIVANSYFSRESILRFYGLNSFVSYLGVDTNVFRPLHLAKEDYVMSVGACTPLKGFDFIVRSLSKIERTLRPRLVIVTNETNPLWRKYIERIGEQEDVQLEIKTLISDDCLVRTYNKAKLFLYAPYLEPFGLGVLEAMACGTPVIAVKEGGVRESVVHNETGLLTERDENLFSGAITELLADEDRRYGMGQRALESIKSFWTLKHAGERLLWHLSNSS